MSQIDTGAVVLSAQQLHLHIANNILIDNQDLLLYSGERVGLVGRNGCGKSTLLRILAGVEHFYTGEINRRKGLRAAFLPQELELPDVRTVRDVVLDGAAETVALLHEYEHTAKGKHLDAIEAGIAARDGWRLETRFQEICTALNVPDPDRHTDALSGGEHRHVALARTLIDLPELLILDEPTNHLDTESIEWLEDYMRRLNGTCLFVTHDRYFLDQTCTRIIELADARLFSYPGNYDDFLRRKAEREAAEEGQEERRLAFIRRESDWISRGPKARGTKSWSRIQRFEAAVNTEARRREQDVDLLIPEPEKLGNIIITLKDVSLERNGHTLFSNLNLDFTPGMRLGVVGRNGIGKTSLLKLILGELQPTTGSVRIGERTVINYADQHRVALNNDKTVFEDVGDGNDTIMFGGSHLSVWTYLKRFLFQDDEINTQVGRLSGGERNRLVLAKILKSGGNVLMFDEPTNDLDLATLRVLEEALMDFPGCCVIVSHDRYFLNRVCTDILAFEDDGQLIFQTGDYAYYRQKRDERYAAAAAAATTTAAAETSAAENQPGKNNRAKPRLTWKEQRELEGMEEQILAAEAGVAELEQIFLQPDFHAKYGRQLPELTAQLEEAKGAVENLYQRWAELEDKTAQT